MNHILSILDGYTLDIRKNIGKSRAYKKGV